MAPLMISVASDAFAQMRCTFVSSDVRGTSEVLLQTPSQQPGLCPRASLMLLTCYKSHNAVVCMQIDNVKLLTTKTRSCPRDSSSWISKIANKTRLVA